ncbi:unnamed protein product, partial [Cercopithifilaria johnstoni]
YDNDYLCNKIQKAANNNLDCDTDEWTTVHIVATTEFCRQQCIANNTMQQN